MTDASALLAAIDASGPPADFRIHTVAFATLLATFTLHDPSFTLVEPTLTLIKRPAIETTAVATGDAAVWEIRNGAGTQLLSGTLGQGVGQVRIDRYSLVSGGPLGLAALALLVTGPGVATASGRIALARASATFDFAPPLATGALRYQGDVLADAGANILRFNPVSTAGFGARGPAGFDGQNGQDGADGISFTPGPTGAQGSPGAPGASIVLFGADGNDGADGISFVPGPAGTIGVDGAPGAPGFIGSDGADGQDGLSFVDNWANVLSRGARSGANNLMVDPGVFVNLGADGPTSGNPQIRSGDAVLRISGSGQVNLQGTIADIIASAGNVFLDASGDLQVITAGGAKLIIKGNGEWQISGSSPAGGSLGQVLTSQGSGTGPIWSAPAGGGSAMALAGQDGADADSSISFVPGATGAPGAQGPAGQSLVFFGDDGNDGSDGISFTPGPPGVAGTQGPAGVAFLMQGGDGNDGADGVSFVPGPAGAAGTNGSQGPAGTAFMAFGADGADGQDAFSVPVSWSTVLAAGSRSGASSPVIDLASSIRWDMGSAGFDWTAKATTTTWSISSPANFGSMTLRSDATVPSATVSGVSGVLLTTAGAASTRVQIGASADRPPFTATGITLAVRTSAIAIPSSAEAVIWSQAKPSGNTVVGRPTYTTNTGPDDLLLDCQGLASRSTIVTQTNNTTNIRGTDNAFILRANTLDVGSMYALELYFTATATAAAPPNIIADILIDATVVATVTTTQLVGVVTAGGLVRGFITCLSIGAAGTFVANALFMFDNATSYPNALSSSANNAAFGTTFNTTADRTISMQIRMGAAVAAASLSVMHGSITRVR